MAKRVTVYDIAQKLNISPSTVSRVLNNSALISNERAVQIQKTAAEMGYKQRPIKKQINRAILNIHLFLPESDLSLTHFFYNVSELLDSIQRGFGSVRLNIITRVNDGNMDFLSFKKTGDIDGCIFAFTQPKKKLSKALMEREIPVILLNRRDDSHSCIFYDTEQGMIALTEDVLKRKDAAVAPCYIGFRSLEALSRERFSGVKIALAGAGLDFNDDNLIFVEELTDIGNKVIPWIIENSYDTAFAFNDYIALSVLHSLMKNGRRVPEDIALTGFDNSPILGLAEQKITTVTLSISALGFRAGEWLKRAIIDKEQHRLYEVMPVEIVPGNTV